MFDIRRVFEGEAPCDKCCMASECKTHELACRAFSNYVNSGEFKDKTIRMPTEYLFNIIFKEDDIALKNYLKRIGEKNGQSELFE